MCPETPPKRCSGPVLVTFSPGAAGGLWVAVLWPVFNIVFRSRGGLGAGAPQGAKNITDLFRGQRPGTFMMCASAHVTDNHPVGIDNLATLDALAQPGSAWTASLAPGVPGTQVDPRLGSTPGGATWAETGPKSTKIEILIYKSPSNRSPGLISVDLCPMFRARAVGNGSGANFVRKPFQNRPKPSGYAIELPGRKSSIVGVQMAHPYRKNLLDKVGGEAPHFLQWVLRWEGTFRPPKPTISGPASPQG